MLSVERTVDWATTERDLPLVQSPVLIVWGDRDRYFPVRLLERFTSALPHATAAVIAGAGHSVHDDQPAQTTQLIRQFLADAGQVTARDGRRLQ
jgi:pimeloyl-ACP methyl ester carboxylesterase